MIFMKDFDEASKKILTACVKMAKDLEIHTLAEGVETKQQLDFLQSIGCERIKGFCYSKPLPTGEFAKLVAEKGIEIENWQQSKLYQCVGLVGLGQRQADLPGLRRWQPFPLALCQRRISERS